MIAGGGNEPLLALEDGGLVAVADDAVLAVPKNRPRQHRAFDVGAQAVQIVNGVLIYVFTDLRQWTEGRLKT